MEKVRPTRAKGRASREAILAAALEVFAERGHRGTSLTQIASRVGMTQPGLLHHFPTKDDLLLEVVQSREARTQRDLAEHLRAGQLHLREAIVLLAKTNQKASMEQMLLTTLSAESLLPDHPLHEHFVNRYRRLREGLADLLKDAQGVGAIRSDIDPEAVARQILATLDGLHLQWLLEPKGPSLVQTMSDYATSLEQLLAPSAPAPKKRTPRR